MTHKEQLAAVRSFFAALYGVDAGRVHFGIGSDPHLTDTGKYEFQHWSQHHRAWPDEADLIEREIAREAHQSDVYVCPNPMHAERRTPAGAVARRVLHAASKQRPEPPPVPYRLMVYTPSDWLPPGEDDDEVHRLAYRRFLDAAQSWHAEHSYGSIKAAVAVPDEPFNAEDLLAYNGVPVTRAELADIQADRLNAGARRIVA